MKRVFDIVISTIGLIVVAPVFLAIGFAITLSSPGPIFFSQSRVGRYQKLFRVYKFRSMVHNAESLGTSVTTAHDHRVTPIGRFLRRTKLDELPQLWNVFMGDMSFVGPRPDVPEIIETYNSEMLRIFDVRPGITSNATLHLRHEEALLALSPVPDEVYELVLVPFKVALAMEHVTKDSFFFDFGILCRTVTSLTVTRGRRNSSSWLLDVVTSDVLRFTIVPEWDRRRIAWSNWSRYRTLIEQRARFPLARNTEITRVS